MTLTATALSVWGFAVLNLLAALVLLRHRPVYEGPRSHDALRLLAALPLVMLALLLACAQAGGNGDTLRVLIDRFQIPLSTVAPGDEAGNTAHLVVADQPEGADLIVRPFADPSRAREALGDSPHLLAEIHARRNAAGVDAWLCLYDTKPNAENGLSGWLVTASGTPDVSTARERCALAGRPVALGKNAPVDVLIALDGPLNGQGKPSPRRKFAVRLGERAIDVRLNTPFRADLGRCDNNSLRLLPFLPDRDDIGFLPSSDLRFAALGSGGRHPLLAPQLLGDTMPVASACAGPETAYRWPWTARDGEARVLGTVMHDMIPWFFLPLIVISTLFLYLLRARYWRERPVEAVVVLGLQWLLVLRIAIGIAGVYNDPAELSRSAIFLEVAAAWLCLPVLATALTMHGARDERRQVPALALFLLAALAAVLLWVERPGALGLPAIALVAATGLALLARMVMRQEDGLLTLLDRGRGRLFGARDPWTLGMLIVTAAAAIRIALALAGMALGEAGVTLKLSERVGPVQLSMIYQPILIVGMALLLWGLIQKPGWRRAAILVGLFGLSIFAVAIVAHDFGIIMIYGWPIGIIVLLAAAKAIGRRSPVVTLLALAPALSPLLIFALAMAWGRTEIPDPATVPPATSMAMAVDWNDGNAMRLMRWAAPEKVERFGNNEAYKLLEQASGMEPLGRALLGSGYLEPVHVRGKIIDYQFMDNITAIHVMAPFGRLGMLCLLLFYAAMALTLTRGLGAPTTANLAAQMAALTLFWSALYMTLANLNLVPFTGRNVYFLAVSSGSDLVEGLILLLIAAFPWLRARAERQEAPAR